jgi:flagellar export protein FliJ
VPAKPRYQFEAFLIQLQGRKESAQRELAAAQGKLQEEEEQLGTLIEERDRLRASRRSWQTERDAGLQAGLWSAAELAGRRDHLRRLATDIDDRQRAVLSQQRAVQRAERVVEEARARLQEISNEVKVHEERKGTWLEGLRREEQRREQKSMEEISQALHERRRRTEP